ncbi:hypothetical protein PIB30_005640 [Stylosanthes scabra]|uniref:Uncharacterized protein n=1 Tax=Stylosanthes scabra TaxID=79078 RepID=A0ABU6T5S5_9FABA|nr:hypothetical protein [Stylosanthes scabra]
MIDAFSGGALMNKTPEEAWEMIETVADANQHFSTRAKSRGVHEVAPSKSTMLAKTLAEVVAMDDNRVAATQDFFEPTANPPYNRQYRSQGWRDNQPIRGNPPTQQQGQQRQSYTYSQPQNNQNVRYQPPHNRQQPYPSTNPPLSVEEPMRIYQKENQEIKEI